MPKFCVTYGVHLPQYLPCAGQLRGLVLQQHLENGTGPTLGRGALSQGKLLAFMPRRVSQGGGSGSGLIRGPLSVEPENSHRIRILPWLSKVVFEKISLFKVLGNFSHFFRLKKSS